MPKLQMQSTHYQDKSKPLTRHTVRKNNHFLICLARAIRQANTVRHILGFGSTRSSGKAYTRAPIFRDIEMAYLAFWSSSYGKEIRTSYTSTVKAGRQLLQHSIYYCTLCIGNITIYSIMWYTQGKPRTSSKYFVTHSGKTQDIQQILIFC